MNPTQIPDNHPAAHPFAPFRPPFRYDKNTGYFFDAKDHMFLDMRGHGFLVGTGGMNLSEEAAAAIQDRIGYHIADLLNRGLLDRYPDLFDKNSHHLSETLVLFHSYIGMQQVALECLSLIARALKKGMAHSRQELMVVGSLLRDRYNEANKALNEGLQNLSKSAKPNIKKIIVVGYSPETGFTLDGKQIDDAKVVGLREQEQEDDASFQLAFLRDAEIRIQEIEA
jgi:hypothetical protein